MGIGITLVEVDHALPIVADTLSDDVGGLNVDRWISWLQEGAEQVGVEAPSLPIVKFLLQVERDAHRLGRVA